MKADGRFIEDITDAAEIRSQLRGETNALRLATGKGIGAAIESQIGEADFG